jgi:hypothetical protein
MALPARTRWILYAIALVVTLVLVRWADRQDHDRTGVSQVTKRAAPRAQADAGPRSAPAAATVAATELDRLTRRAPSAPAVDPFAARSWEQMMQAKARLKAGPPPGPPKPRPPPLPFSYFGKLVQDGKITVFLTKGDDNYIVHAGDKLDGAYAVNEITNDRIVFTYLALGVKQTLSLEADAARPPPPEAVPGQRGAARPARPASAEQPSATAPRFGLFFAAPAQAQSGSEFNVQLAIPTGTLASSVLAVIAYDPKAVEPVGESVAAPGRVQVEVSGASVPGAQPPQSDVRFRVLADAQGATDLRGITECGVRR